MPPCTKASAPAMMPLTIHLAPVIHGERYAL
jgi:hypothetical protein